MKRLIIVTAVLILLLTGCAYVPEDGTDAVNNGNNGFKPSAGAQAVKTNQTTGSAEDGLRKEDAMLGDDQIFPLTTETIMTDLPYESADVEPATPSTDFNQADTGKEPPVTTPIQIYDAEISESQYLTR